MKLFGKRKYLLFLGAGVSILGVLVAAFCTAAWFAIDSQNVSFSNTASSTNLTIDNSNVTGYKHVPTLGADGFPDYLSTTAVSKKGTTYETINNNQDTADTNFDVPAEGLGYYLLQENGKTYKYKSGYYWKFKEVEESGVKYLTTGTINKTFNVGDKFIVKHYSYNPSKYETTNTRTKLVKDRGNITVDEYNSETNPNPSYEITVTTQSSYKAWLYLPASDSDPRKVSFESSFDVSSVNKDSTASSLNVLNNGISRMNASATTGNKRINVIVDSNTNTWIWNNNAEIKIKYKDGDFVTPSVDTDLNYGNTSANTTKSNTRQISLSNTTYYACTYSFGSTSWPSTTWWGITVGRTGTEDNNKASDTDGGVWTSKFNTVKYDGNSCVKWGFYFKVCYHYGANNNTTSADLVYANNFSPADAPARSGYHFDYWCTDSSLNNRYTTTTLTGDINLYAKYTPNASSTKASIYVYDNQAAVQNSDSVDIVAGPNWATLYCYAYGSSLYPENNTWPGKTGTSDPYVTVTSTNYSYTDAAGTQKTYKIWTVSISVSYPNIILNNGNSFNNNQSIDIEGWQNHIGEYLVLTKPYTGFDANGNPIYNSNDKIQCKWYSSVTAYTNPTSQYHVYDKDDTLRSNSGSATIHAWKYNSAGTAVTSSTAASASFYVNWTTDWNTVRIGSPTLNMIYTFSIPSLYDSFVLSNGKASKTTSGAFQTQDLTGSDGLSGHAGYYFILKGQSATESGGVYTVPGEWAEQIDTVSLCVTFMLQTGENEYKLFDTSKLDAQRIVSNYTYSGEKLTPSVKSKNDVNGGNDYEYYDNEYGIIYHFDVPSPVNNEFTWYKNKNATYGSATFDIGNEVPPAALYIRAVCDVRRLVSIYVDDAIWNNEALSLKDSGNTSTYFTWSNDSKWKVANGLYKITMRDDWTFQLSSGAHTNYNLTAIGANGHTGIPDMSTVDPSDQYKADKTYYRNDRSYLYIKSSGAGSNWTWASFASDSTSTGVYVQKYKASTSRFENIEQDGNPVELVKGDGTGNDYILETGLVLTQGDIIRVYDSNTSTGYGFSSYVPGNVAKHQYVKTGQSGDGITISNLGSGGTQERFNFYLTHAASPENRMLSIAMVPLFGNGYYIMNYDSAMTTHNYFNAKKMDSAETSASYDGWYCDNTSVGIFIKSYLNGVDKIIDSMTTNSATYIDIHEVPDDEDRFYITFKETGHYNIRVDGTKVDVSEYFVNDFFSLNRLDSSLVTGDDDAAKQQEIWRQKTAIVLEVPFTANNTFDTSISIRVNCSASFIGVRSAVYASKQPNPYNLMHGTNASTYTTSYLTAANAATALTPDNKTRINANTSTTLYAYIIIDYRYTVTSSDLVGATPELSFYIQLTQI